MVILLLSTSILAFTAAFRKKHAARGVYISVFFVLSGTGETINHMFDTSSGRLLRIQELIYYANAQLIGVNESGAPGNSAYLVLTAIFVCSLVLLYCKIKPVEVIT